MYLGNGAVFQVGSIRLVICFGALIASCVFGTAGKAASFDCAKAGNRVERAICRDAEASKLDEQMASAYGVALAKMSPASAVELRASQRSFLAFLRAACEGQTDKRDGTGSALDFCLEDKLSKRGDVLRKAVRHAGGRTFVTLTTYRTWRPAPDWDADLPEREYEIGRVEEGTRTLVQIDRPATATERRWNIMMRAELPRVFQHTFSSEHPMPRGAPDPKSPQDSDAELELLGASQDVIAVRAIAYRYTWGLPHGSDDTRNIVWSLSLKRKITANDIFDATKDWRHGLAAAARRILKTKNSEGDWRAIDTLDELSANQAMRFMRRGICLAFDPYELGYYVPPQPAILPWRVVQPYLARKLPEGWNRFDDTADCNS